MATNVYFSQKIRSEQHLYEDIVIESLKMYGQDVYYLPREIVNVDTILNEDIHSQFNSAYTIEMYIENVNGFEGDGDLLSKFGVEIRDQATFIISRRRWEQLIGINNNGITSLRPVEGDLIYLPLANSLFEIRFVEDEAPFYQLSNLAVYKLQCELFEYSTESFNTGIGDFDNVINKDITAQIRLQVANGNGTSFEIGEIVRQEISVGSNEYIEGKAISRKEVSNDVHEIELSDWKTTNGKYHIFNTQNILVGDTSQAEWSVSNVYDINDTLANRAFINEALPQSQNQEFEVIKDDIIDFTESNPFGEIV